MLHQTLDNWLRADNLGKLSGTGDRVVTPEQMELAHLRAENARYQSSAKSFQLLSIQK